MRREIIIYNVTAAKISRVDVEHALPKRCDEDCGFVFETKAWLELDNAAVQSLGIQGRLGREWEV